MDSLETRSALRRPRGQRRLLAALALVAAAAVVASWQAGWLSAGEDSAAAGAPTGAFIPSEETSPAVVWAVGDGANGGAEAKKLAGRIARSRVDRFLYLGDVYASGTASDYERHYAPVYGRLASFTAPTPGNHEWPNHRRGYDPYWKAVTGRAPPAYYAFTIGGWQILSLNSETSHGARSAQLEWLRGQLARAGTCRLAFWHRPRYSAGVVHGDQEDVQPFWDALRGHARIVVNGHEHDMQRLSRGGIVELVSGAGGESLYHVDPDYPGLAFGNDGTFGALRLELQPGLARFAFVARSGRVLDSGTVRCRPLAA